MMQNKFYFGITGGTGSGKSTVSDMFRDFGYDVIDCDKVARAVTEKDKPCLCELKDVFGADIIDSEGNLLRRELAKIVFSDKEKLDCLNKITHKYILDEIYRMGAESQNVAVGIDGAVLFESGVTDNCVFVIGVIAPRDVRMERIIKRDGITRDEAQRRIESQKNDDFYLEKCDIILYNNGNRHELNKQVKEVVSKLENQVKRYGEKNVTSV